jgi:hypothetical protein
MLTTSTFQHADTQQLLEVHLPRGRKGSLSADLLRSSELVMHVVSVGPARQGQRVLCV